MKIKPPNYKSIAFKLAVTFVAAILVQCILMSATLVLGGVISQTQKNAHSDFSGKVANRKKNLEDEMNNVWTNVAQYTQNIKEEFTAYRNLLPKDQQNSDEILEQISPLLVDALRNTKTTGVYLILDDDAKKDNTHSAIYIRDTDPNRNSTDNSDLSLMAGPWNVAKSMGIFTDNKWDLRLQLTEENQAFYRKPFDQLQRAEDERLVSYWCPPFRLNPGEEEVITYSIPLADASGKAIGVFGVEIAVDYLYSYLPATDLATQDSYGYVIGIQNGAGKDIEPLITQGALQSRMLEHEKPLSLTRKKQTQNVYTLNNHHSQSEIFAAVDKLGMYYNNTPFDKEEWYLVGLMEKSVLLGFTMKIRNIILISLGVTLLTGVFVAVFISRWFTKPIISLAKQVKTGTSEGIPMLSVTGLSEIDDLASAISTSQKSIIDLSAKLSNIIELTDIPFGAFEISNNVNSVFFTDGLPALFNLSEKEAEELSKDKDKFINLLEKICENTENDPEVVCLNNDGNARWVRIIQTKTDDSILGIAIDITQEMLQANCLRKERDHDSLTGIRNRNAYNEAIADYSEKLEGQINIGIGVFDLNGLKYVNDHFGHNKGDDYICICADIICTTFSRCPVFRLGGDEFVAIFVDSDKAAVEKLQEDMQHKIRQKKKQCEHDMGIAFGYAFYEHGRDHNLEDVFHRADNNMYDNKRELKRKSNTGLSVF